MKKEKIITLKQAGYVPVDKLRTYAEILIEKFPEHFQSFEEMDKYRIFFPRMKWKHQERILLFRGQIIYAMRIVLGDCAVMQDLAMIFKMKNHSSVIYSMKKVEIESGFIKTLKSEMLEIHKSARDTSIATPEDTHVLVSCIINKRQWKCFVPKEYIEFSELLFNEVQREVGISKDVVCSNNRSNEVVLARDIFISIFHRKYPNASEMFIACILKRKYHSTINHSFYRQFNYRDPATQKSRETIRFHDLVEKIKNKVL